MTTKNFINETAFLENTTIKREGRPSLPVVTDEFVEELAQMTETSPLTYTEACAAYLAWSEEQPGDPQLPNTGLSDEWFGIWHLANVNGPLAAVTSDGEVIQVRDFHAAYERLSEQGKCDSPGRWEYYRALVDWIEESPGDLDEFIICRAKVLPEV